MPTYSYTHLNEHTDCMLGNEFDVVQSIKDASFKVCGQCNKQVKRIITSAPGFTMQGGTPKFHG